jgi:IclR family pca regulon transcriptional regulator
MAEDDGSDEVARERDFVQSLARGLQVLRAFSAERATMTLSEVANETGLTRATARRLVLTLESLGYLRSDGRRFEPTSRILELSRSYLATKTIWDDARPFVVDLVNETFESSSIAVLDELDAVLVARVPTNRIMSIALTVGARLPATCSSTGRVMLAALDAATLEQRLAAWVPSRLTERTIDTLAGLHAELQRVREQGFALVDQEIEMGVRSLAVPLHDRHGTVIASVNVSAHASRVTAQRLRREFLPPLQRAARNIEAEIARR